VSEMWRQIAVPGFCERLIGFSVPQDDEVLVVSYEGMHVVRLGSPVTVETDFENAEYDLYDPETGVCRYREKDWNIIGLFPGQPLHFGMDGERLVLDSKKLTVSVIKEGDVVWSSSYKNFSGDWASATFSPDGRFIVLGCPYDVDFRVWERVSEA
jgi:hypothetical protein